MKPMQCGRRGLVLAVLMSLAVSGGVQAQEGASADARQLTVQQTTVVNWTPPAPVAQPALKPTAWMSKGDRLYQPGENAVIYVQSPADAYITVINVNAAGQITQLFPNAHATNNLVRARQTLAVGTGVADTARGDTAGYTLGVGTPYGGNVLKVFASDRPIDWLRNQPTARSGAFTTVGGDVPSFVRTLTVNATAPAPAAAATATTTTTTTTTTGAQQAAPKVATTEVVWGVVQPPAGQPAVNTTTGQGTTPAGTNLTVPAPAPAPVPATLPVSLRPSDFGLTLAANKTTFANGEQMTLTLTPERRCSLVLLDVAPDGSYQVLVPNAVDKQQWLPAGRTTFVSGAESEGKIQAGGAGAHTLVALCNARQTFTEWLFGNSSYRSGGAGRTQVVVKQPSLAEVLSKQPDGLSANATLTYTVTP